jgi:hypothetical protein
VDAFRTAIPIFISVVLGIYLVASGLKIFIVVITLVVFYAVGKAFQMIARSLVDNDLRLAIFIWQFALFVPMAGIAATTYATTYVSLEATDWLKAMPGNMVDRTWLAPRASDIGKALVGALNTLIAAVWLDHAKSSASTLWPSGQIKEAFNTSFRELLDQWRASNDPCADSLQRAIMDERATDEILGWGYPAALQRLEMVRRLKAGTWPCS